MVKFITLSLQKHWKESFGILIDQDYNNWLAQIFICIVYISAPEYPECFLLKGTMKTISSNRQGLMDQLFLELRTHQLTRATEHGTTIPTCHHAVWKLNLLSGYILTYFPLVIILYENWTYYWMYSSTLMYRILWGQRH